MNAAAPAGPDRNDAELRSLRNISRRLTTGVSVLTVTHLEAVHGGTVSTTSVIAQRPLTLCASLRRGSYLARLALESRRFVVNVLSSRQALVADWFANPDRPPGIRQFELVAWDPEPGSGTPLLRGALAHLVCRVTEHISIGDSDELLVAEIASGLTGIGRPLVSFDGQLHDVEFHDVTRRRGWRAPAGILD